MAYNPIAANNPTIPGMGQVVPGMAQSPQDMMGQHPQATMAAAPQMQQRSPDTAAGIANALAAERDPKKKISMAMQIIMSMGETGFEIVKQALSSEELQMLIQLVEGASEQGVGGLNTAANGGRIGYAQGTDDEGVVDPDFDLGGEEELFREIEAQGGLKTASMGDDFISALEDAHWMELDGWLGKYGHILGEEDYFKFRTMGPQVKKRKGLPVTEGVASLRV